MSDLHCFEAFIFMLKVFKPAFRGYQLESQPFS